MSSKVFSVATNQDGIEFLCEYGEPVFNLSSGSILLNEHLSSDAITRPATMGEINAWRRVKTPHSFTDIGRPAISSVKQEVRMTNVPCKQGDKIYFGRGPLEFIGFVTGLSLSGVSASGVETGCLATKRSDIFIERLEYVRVLDNAEWERRIQNEPAFADSMPKERFLSLQSELESLEMSIAMGQESDSTDARIHEIELLMGNAPWVMCPDNGCISKPTDADTSTAQQ